MSAEQATPSDGSAEDISSRAKIEAYFAKNGPSTTVEMRARGLEIPALSAYVANLAKRGILEKIGGYRGSTIYDLAGKNMNAAQFSLDERGELKIGNGQNALRLSRGSIRLLKEFLERTEDVWCPE